MKSPDLDTQPAGLVFDQRYPDLGQWLRRTSLQDLVAATDHSGDFCSSRAEYIYMRVRLLAFAFTVLALLWVPIDLLLLEPEVLWPILGLRVGFSGLFLLLGLWVGRSHSLHTAWLRMAVFMAIPAAFYVSSRSVLGGGLPEHGVMVGYSFLPYLMVSLMAIFPLTLLEGLAYAGAMTLTVIGTELAHDNLFTLNALGEVWLLVLLAGIAIWAQLAQLHMLLRLYREATRDALTGLINRRALTHALEVELMTADQENRPLSVLLFDLDLFKRINDQYGHLTGDAVLQAFGRILETELPNPDLIGRYGGEEFLAILPDTDIDQAQAVAERIRAACHEASIRIEGGLVHFTTSIGVARWSPGETATALLNRVDQGLYQAKEAGRDLVVAAG
ncbi:MAG TPA: GGDEF domain-containing protein [Gammaproteobacteria bacterium]|nr:GGDEF domain-containing protein [Gammaproteobacteria bacterium]